MEHGLGVQWELGQLGVQWELVVVEEELGQVELGLEIKRELVVEEELRL
jgi:hypothetical protein